MAAMVQGTATLRGQRFQTRHPQCCDTELASPWLQGFLPGLTSTHWMPVTTFPAIPVKTPLRVAKCLPRTSLPRMENPCSTGTTLSRKYRMLPRHTFPALHRFTVRSSSRWAFHGRGCLLSRNQPHNRAARVRGRPPSHPPSCEDAQVTH